MSRKSRGLVPFTRIVARKHLPTRAPLEWTAILLIIWSQDRIRYDTPIVITILIIMWFYWLGRASVEQESKPMWEADPE